MLVDNPGSKYMTLACSMCKSAKGPFKLTNMFSSTGLQLYRSPVFKDTTQVLNTIMPVQIAENKARSDCTEQEDPMDIISKDIAEEDKILFNIMVNHAAKDQEPSEKVNRHLAL